MELTKFKNLNIIKIRYNMKNNVWTICPNYITREGLGIAHSDFDVLLLCYKGSLKLLILLVVIL